MKRLRRRYGHAASKAKDILLAFPSSESALSFVMGPAIGAAKQEHGRFVVVERYPGSMEALLERAKPFGGELLR